MLKLTYFIPGSAHALPNAYAQLMLDDQSPIFEFYPLGKLVYLAWDIFFPFSFQLFICQD